MKSLNNMKFVTESLTGLNGWIEAIDAAKTFEKAKEKAAAALGYIDCMITYLNCMIDKENNEFTAELDEILDTWTARVYQHIGSKAITTNQAPDTVIALLKKRDSYMHM